MNLIFLKENKIFAGFLLLIFLGYMWLVWQPIDKLIIQFLVDDAFYYFKLASNMALGLGPTFDGEHPTNGYHPLWMGINTLIFYFSPNDKLLPIHLALTLAVLLFFGTTLICWKIISQMISDRAVQIVLVLAYALSPWNLSNFLDGLETPLAVFLLALLFWLFLNILDGKRGAMNFFFLGLVNGLMVLARLDYGLFSAAIFLFFLFKKEFSWRSIFIFALPSFVLAMPWFLYNYFYFGSPIPSSGLSYTLINHRLWFYKDRSLGQIMLWSLYCFFGTIAANLRTIGLPNFYSATDFWKSFFSLGKIFFPIMLAITYFYAAKKEQFKKYLKSIAVSNEWRALLTFFIAYAGLVIGHGAIRWSGREWYFASFPLLVIFLTALFLSRQSLIIYQRKIILFFILFFILFLGRPFISSWEAVFTQNINQSEMYDTAIWIKDNFPGNIRLAAFNSGILGYFSDHFVMNSDGLINNSAYEAMKQNRLWELFKKENIDYIVDYEITLTYRFKPFFGIEDPLAETTKVDFSSIPLSDSYGGSHFKIFKIN